MFSQVHQTEMVIMLKDLFKPEKENMDKMHIYFQFVLVIKTKSLSK